jgi:hypothetical protein
MADRTRSVRTLYVAAFLVFAAGVGGVTLSLGRTGLALPLGSALVAGVAGPLLSGGLTSLLPHLVAPPGLPRAFALDTGTYNVAGVAGPALVAATASVASATAASTAVAVTAVTGALLFLLVPAPVGRSASPGPIGWTALVAGLVPLVRIPPLRAATLASTVSLGGFGALPVGAALLATQTGRSAAEGGALLSAFAAGAVVGSAVLTLRPVTPGRTALALYAGLAGMAVALGSAAAADTFVVVLVLFAVAGSFDAPLLTATYLIRSAYAPAAVLTQVFTTAAGLKISASAVGAAAAGLTADALGGRGLVLAVAATQVIAILAGLLSGASRRGAA